MANAVFEDLKQKIKSGGAITRLIVVNSAVFLFFSLLQVIYYGSGAHSTSGQMVKILIRNLSFPLNGPELLSSPWTILTGMFLHGDLLHIFWNMITLYWFGRILADYTSAKKITPLYILGGIAGALVTFILVNVTGALAPYRNEYLIGASASVTALIIAVATLVPNVKVNIIFIGPVKLLYVAFFVIFINVLNISYQSFIIGNLSHLGGALMGFIFTIQYKKGRDMTNGMSRFFDWIRGLFGSGGSRMKVVHKRSVSDEEYNYNRKMEQENVDRILDKISRSGYDSLTKQEKDILFKASKK